MGERPTPDLSRLQQELRVSRAMSANGQRILDDPSGAALKAQARELRETALRAGRPDLAAEAAEILAVLEEKERLVRESLRAADAAERHGIRTILRVLDGSL